jgi:hypothetical protein
MDADMRAAGQPMAATLSNAEGKVSRGEAAFFSI